MEPLSDVPEVTLQVVPPTVLGCTEANVLLAYQGVHTATGDENERRAA